MKTKSSFTLQKTPYVPVDEEFKGKFRPLHCSSKVIKLESYMIKKNLKFTKSDIGLAARMTNIPINRALLHFQKLKTLFSDEKEENNKKLLKIIKKVEKRIEKLIKNI